MIIGLLLCRSWSKQYLIYVYGTYLTLFIELIWLQLFVDLGDPEAQKRRKSGLRPALRKIWQRCSARFGETDELLPVRACSCSGMMHQLVPRFGHLDTYVARSLSCGTMARVDDAKTGSNLVS